jgi:hypothetical protein
MDNQTEAWAPWPRDHRFSVSSLGRVRSRLGRYVGTRNADGYWVVSVGRGADKKLEYTHIMVLETFVGPCPAGLECRHLDGNSGNAVLDNLAWGTHRENLADKRLHGTSSILTKMSPEKDALAWKLREDGATLRAIATKIGVSHGTINHLFQGKRQNIGALSHG